MIEMRPAQASMAYLPPLLRIWRVGRLGPRGELASLAVLLSVALGLRLVLLPVPGTDDIDFYTSWANTLRQVPLSEFYDHDLPQCDYLPGYLYILAATAWIPGLVVDSPAEPQRFGLWIKLTPVAADMVLGVVAFLLCRRFLGPKRSLIATALVVFNPGLVLVGAVWGQVDSVGAALSMLSLLALVSGWPVLAAAAAGMSFVVKPQYTLFLAVAGAAYVRTDLLSLARANTPRRFAPWARWAVFRVATPALILAATVQLLLLPFSVSLWPMENVEWTLLDRLGVAAAETPVTSAGAFNLWGTPIARLWQTDATSGWLSLSYRTWGLLLTGVAMSLTLGLAWAKADDFSAVIWACFVAALAFFVLPTRIHERYLFAAIPLASAAAVSRPWMAPYYVATSVLYFANLWPVFRLLSGGQGGPDWTRLTNLVTVGSVFAVLLLVACLAGLVTLMASKKGAVPNPAESGSDSRHLFTVTRGGPGTRTTPILGGGIFRPRGPEVVLSGGLILIACSVGLTLRGDGGVETQTTRTVMVRAFKPWQNTGIELTEGQRFSVSARGDWTNRRGGDRFGPGGSQRTDGGTIMPDVPIGVLLGRIGESSPFVIGESRLLTADSSGALQLVMNDWLDDRQDGQGNVTVSINLQP